MKKIIEIAKNTFLETIRDRILYGILAFALLFLISTLFLGSISLGEDIRIIKDLGLAAIYIFSVIITIFIGTSLIQKELEKRTIYILLSKSVSIKEFIIGKFIGLFSSILVNVFFMTIVYLIIVLLKNGGVDYLSLLSVLLLVFELAIFVAITILFSCFTTPFASMIYSVSILYIGHSLSTLRQATTKTGGFAKILGDATYYIFPNLEKFNIRNTIVYGIVPSADQVIYPICYSIFLTIILLWLSITVLKKQEL